jgi:hypothetical protein
MADGRVGEHGTPQQLASGEHHLLNDLREAEEQSGFARYTRVEVGRT